MICGYSVPEHRQLCGKYDCEGLGLPLPILSPSQPNFELNPEPPNSPPPSPSVVEVPKDEPKVVDLEANYIDLIPDDTMGLVNMYAFINDFRKTPLSRFSTTEQADKFFYLFDNRMTSLLSGTCRRMNRIADQFLLQSKYKSLCITPPPSGKTSADPIVLTDSDEDDSNDSDYVTDEEGYDYGSIDYLYDKVRSGEFRGYQYIGLNKTTMTTIYHFNARLFFMD